MKSNKPVIFILVTTLFVIAAVMLSKQRAPTTSLLKPLLFPELLEQVNQVSVVSITKQDKSLTLMRSGTDWGIQQADNYAADFGKIRASVIAVANLAIVAEKTSNADLYKKLGVEDPSADSATSMLLSLQDNAGTTLASLIVGEARHSKSPGDKSGLYVRLPEDKTALLVEGELDISVDVKDWFKRELFSISANRIKRIHITHADGSEVTLGRDKDTDDFSLGKLPEGLEMQSSIIISRMGTLLEDIFVDNVIKADKLNEKWQSTVNIETFDGLQVTINSTEMDGKNYSSFSFAARGNAVDLVSEEKVEKDAQTTDSKPDPSKEAEQLNTIMSGWAYAIPSFKYELFTRTLEQLTKKIEATDEAASAKAAKKT